MFSRTAPPHLYELVVSCRVMFGRVAGGTTEELWRSKTGNMAIMCLQGEFRRWGDLHYWPRKTLKAVGK